MIIQNDTYSVYVHINKNNNKMYVGTTSKVPASKRWCGNGIGYKRNKRFYQDIIQFGWDNFEHNVIASSLTEQEASHMEKLLIEKFKTTNPEYGYNIEQGGLCKTEKSRRKRISESISGENHPLFGTERSPETRKKLKKPFLEKMVIGMERKCQHTSEKRLQNTT